MTILFSNNAASTLTAGINTTDTTIAVADGSLFPSPTGGNAFYATLTQSGTETSWEIVRVTARSGNNLTVTRAQDGTAAASWGSGAKFEIRLSAAVMDTLVQTDDSRLTDSRAPSGAAGGVLSGTYPNPGFAVDMATQAELDAVAAAKQNTLVSGTSIKTINSTSLLGSGNLAVEPTITAGTTAQYWRGDKSWQTLDKTAVGLGNVDNTSNATERAATATLTNKTLTDPKLTFAGSSGEAGQMLVSQGSGLAPQWGDAPSVPGFILMFQGVI